MSARAITALSDEEREAYRQHVEQVLREADSLDGAMQPAVQELLKGARDSLTAKWMQVIDTGTEWDAFIYPQIMRATAEVSVELGAKLDEKFATFLPRRYDVGVRLVDSALGASRIKIGPMPAVSPETVKIAAHLEPRLIRNVSDEMVLRVQKAVQRAFVVGDSPYEMTQNIARTGIDKGVWPSVAHRAETIARTEGNRVQSLAAQSRMQHVHSQHPEIGMRKQWIVAQVKQWPCPQCRPLDGQTWEINDASAPIPPLHPRCACVVVPYVPGFGETTGDVVIPSTSRQ